MNREHQDKTIDDQLAEWRKKFDKEIPERVGLAFYTNEKGETEVEVYFADDNMWLSQATMAQLFDVEEHTITYHLMLRNFMIFGLNLFLRCYD